MLEYWQRFTAWKYFNELAFLFAVLLMLGALKFAKEGLIGE